MTMQKFDKIYIPVNQMAQEGVYLIATERITTKPLATVASLLLRREWLEEHDNKILTTIEDLREVFMAGYNRSGDEWHGSFNQHAVNQPDFKTYLKNKGIEL